MDTPIVELRRIAFSSNPARSSCPTGDGIWLDVYSPVKEHRTVARNWHELAQLSRGPSEPANGCCVGDAAMACWIHDMPTNVTLDMGKMVRTHGFLAIRSQRSPSPVEKLRIGLQKFVLELNSLWKEVNIRNFRFDLVDTWTTLK